MPPNRDSDFDGYKKQVEHLPPASDMDIDGYEKQVEHVQPARICAWICLFACFGAVTTLWVYFGIYAFDNPNVDAYYMPGDGTTANPGLLVGEQNAEGSLVPIHNMFVMWFTWSFANICSFFALMFCIMPMIALSSRVCGEMVPKICGGLCLCGVCCSSIACFITGAVYRFSEAGVYASVSV